MIPDWPGMHFVCYGLPTQCAAEPVRSPAPDDCNQVGIVYPSPAENFYLEERWRREEEWAYQQREIAQLNAAVSAQFTGLAAESSEIASDYGAQMRYAEQTLDIGDIQIESGFGNQVNYPIPGEFGTVLSFVATLSNAGFKSEWSEFEEAQWLWWSFVTSVDGENWLLINAPGAQGYFIQKANSASSARLHGPFGNRLSLRLGCKRSNTFDDTSWLPGKWTGLRLSIGVQRV